jgi:hypothetical protein
MKTTIPAGPMRRLRSDLASSHASSQTSAAVASEREGGERCTSILESGRRLWLDRSQGRFAASGAVAWATVQEIGANNTLNGCYRVSRTTKRDSCGS